ncbi:MAG: magnesium transporter CorA family protein [Candidatus Kerfeldbacteria bacterium]|nr:magnesium transporter CorA family protein [Candidatus Kerfeldbacteria bacterium]
MIPENITIIERGNFRWVNIEEPDRAAMKYLKENFAFHVLDYEDITSTTHRSKIDIYQDYVFIILLVPILNRKTNQMTASEIDFFLGADYLVTIHRGNVPTFIDMFQLCEASDQAREQFMSRSGKFLLYKILQRLLKYCYPLLDEIDAEIEKIETEIFSSKEQKLLQQILFVRHNIIDMRKIMQPHRATLFRLKKTSLGTQEEYEEYFDDLVDYTEEIWNQLESFKESIDALQETNESLISYRINDVIKTLTVFSAVMLPAGVVASIFGMNALNIPFHGVVNDFYIFTGLTFLAMLATLLYIRGKRLL